MSKTIKIIKLSKASCLIYTKTPLGKTDTLRSYKFGELAFLDETRLYMGDLFTEHLTRERAGNDKKLIEELTKQVMFAKVFDDEENQLLKIVVIPSRENKQMLRCTLTLQLGKDPKKYLFQQYGQYTQQKSMAVDKFQELEYKRKAVLEQKVSAFRAELIKTKQELKKQKNKVVYAIMLIMKKLEQLRKQNPKKSSNVKISEFFTKLQKIKDWPNEPKQSEIKTAMNTFLPSQHYR